MLSVAPAGMSPCASSIAVASGVQPTGATSSMASDNPSWSELAPSKTTSLAAHDSALPESSLLPSWP